MKLLSQKLMSELQQRLDKIHSETAEPLEYAEHGIKASIAVLEKLKTKFILHQFQNKTDEIEFFRYCKPQLASKLIYYNEIFTITSNKPIGSKKTIRNYYKAELAKLEFFFNENLEFYRYYRTGNQTLDNKYFVRGKFDVKLTLDSFYFQADQRFSTSHDYKVAKILANDALKVFLESEMQKLDEIQTSQSINDNHKGQSWTGSKVALIELIYALHAEGVFNNGQSELKEVVKSFESAFGVDLGQFHRVFLEIRARKSERTKFLNSLKDKLVLRMDDADEI
ncbi:MAG: RteC domain-containing protein [Flavobacterium sp. JAD_PAG50586_2]|nr:MAG: RteC domain-containing protein [Flavobacterium sp. JAD_PAG50586_2]